MAIAQRWPTWLLTRGTVFGAGGLLFLGLLVGGLVGVMTVSAAQTLGSFAGSESPDSSVQVNEFAPRAFTINEGDTITWRIGSTEFHTITFLAGAPEPPFVTAGPSGVFLNPAVVNPVGGNTFDGSTLVNSGLLNKADTFSLTFTKAGVYPFVCVVHPDMTGTITVVPVGQKADDRDSSRTRGIAEIMDGTGNHGVPLLAANTGELAMADGSIGVVAGAGDNTVQINRFLPATTIIHPGDSITWQWTDSNTPHTVTFAGDQPEPDLVMPQPQPQGPPALMLNPVVLAPAGDPTQYSGGYLNSGFLDPTQAPPGSPLPAFKVTFTQPGSYPYTCILHEGMDGTVIVQ